MRSPPRSPESFLPLTPSALHILLALGERGPLHGYAIMRAVERRTAGRMKLGPGNLYGSMQRMLRDGLVAEVEESGRDDSVRRRYYALTQLGRRVIALESERLARLVDWARAAKILKGDPA